MKRIQSQTDEISISKMTSLHRLIIFKIGHMIKCKSTDLITIAVFYRRRRQVINGLFFRNVSLQYNTYIVKLASKLSRNLNIVIKSHVIYTFMSFKEYQLILQNFYVSLSIQKSVWFVSVQYVL